ncbi:MAG: hypothetical protein CM15mV47_760 [uncultured marine virus]|nr:MAG: hypothetical protein CM15mV47_760 [uncultured marine virus]
MAVKITVRGNEAGYGAGGGYGLTHARGGKIGYVFGTLMVVFKHLRIYRRSTITGSQRVKRFADNRDREFP